MKKTIIILAIVALVSVIFATTMTVHTTNGDVDFEISEIESITFGSTDEVIFLEDNFESYQLETFPSSGNWTMAYNGAGDQFQYITNQYSNSMEKSFRLQGQSGWGARIDNHLPETPNVIYMEASFFSESVNDEGSFGVNNPDIGTWGGSFINCQFVDGSILAGENEILDYTPGNWYNVKIKADILNSCFSVWINDISYLTDEYFTYPDDYSYTHFFIHAWNNGSDVVFFDDIKVWTE